MEVYAKATMMPWPKLLKMPDILIAFVLNFQMVDVNPRLGCFAYNEGIFKRTPRAIYSQPQNMD